MEDIQLPEGFISVYDSKPKLYKNVICFMDNGTEMIGHFYDNPYRSGWMTLNKQTGFYSNLIWSGIRVIGWKEIELEQ